MPREARTLDAHRKLTDAGEDRQLPHVVNRSVRRRRNHLAEALEQLLDLAERLPLPALGHDRSRRLRDGAARPLEARVLDAAIPNAQIDSQPVAAERVVALGLLSSLDRMKIAGAPVVIEDHFLIQLLQF